MTDTAADAKGAMADAGTAATALRATRGTRKASVTKMVRNLNRYVAERNAKAVSSQLTLIQKAFENFDMAHDNYHSTLTNDKDIDESDCYYDEIVNNYICAMDNANRWLSEKGNFSSHDIKESNVLDILSMSQKLIDPFKGDPLLYKEFIAIFDASFHLKDIDDQFKLNKLLQFTDAEAKASIRHTALIGGSEGYKQAREILETRFGDSYLIAQKVIDNLKFGGPVCTPEELQQLSTDLCAASETLKTFDLTSEIDHQRAMLTIVKRCTNEIVQRWKKLALKKKLGKKHGTYPNFNEFVDFFKLVAAEAMDPVYGYDALRSLIYHDRDNFNVDSNAISGIQQHRSQVRFSDNKSNTSKSLISPCPLCQQQHTLFSCTKFKSLTVPKRVDYVKSANLCYLCLEPNHLSKDCTRKYTCSVCSGRHSKFIHLDQFPRVDGASMSDNSVSLPATPATTFRHGSASNACIDSHDRVQFSSDLAVYLPIVPVIVNGSQSITYALLDSGSTHSFISQSAVSQLGLQKCQTNYKLNTVSNNADLCTYSVSLKLRSIQENDYEVFDLENVLVVPKIPARHPGKVIDIKAYRHLSDLPLGCSGGGVTASMIIGMDSAHLLAPYDIRYNPDNRNDVYAVQTRLGWVLSGPVPGVRDNQAFSNCIQTELEEQVENLWKIEGGESNDYVLSAEDKEVLELWERETVIEQGRYVVPIPWRGGVPTLPDNRSLASHRLHSLVRRLDKLGIRDRYDAEIRKLLDKGYAEPVPDDELYIDNGTVNYVPHHHVISAAKGGKLRVVMDFSSRFRGVSLNESCFSGPNLINNLLYVLLRFRQYQFAVTADIEAMYMQVRVPVKDRNCLRFLWFDGEGNIIHLRMRSHPFGAVFAGSACCYALRRVCVDQHVSGMINDVIQNSFYVDDVLRSMMQLDEVRQVIRESVDSLKCGGFNLTKFIVNDSGMQAEIASEHKVEVKEIAPDSTSRALGVCWSVSGDHFFYVYRQASDDGVSITRRSILRQVCTLYDPLGLIAPIIMKGRMLFQEVTRLKLQWDEVVPDDIAVQWRSWERSLEDLSSMRFDRCLIPTPFVDGVAELIHFCDASSRGYGACSYVRIITKDAQVRVVLVMSKGRVAPIHTISIPRLELCAAVQAIRLDVLLRREMNIAFVKSTYFTDSQIVLGYIRNETKRYKVFVSNRVSEIRRHSSSAQWHYVESSLNCSDVLSRGCLGGDVPSSWWTGPDFLSCFKHDWPREQTIDLMEDDPEVIKSASVLSNACVSDGYVSPLDKLLQHYSSWYRVKKAVAWLLRFCDYTFCQILRKGVISTAELSSAETLIIKHEQSKFFGDELDRLGQGKPIKRASNLVKLDPILQDDVLVVGGRLSFSSLSQQVKHPIILPRDSLLSKLIIMDEHNATHLGVEWTLSRVRCKYWIIKARNMVKAIKRACVVCKKLYAPPAEQKMSNLPSERLDSCERAFTYTGFDIFGPFYVISGRHEVKMYGLIFTCFTTRAVHIEVLASLETDAFLNAFVRFISRRGAPNKVLCDNAKTFVGARNELADMMREVDTDRVVQYTRQLNIEWTFNPPYASHHGGIWERLIRVVRNVLAAILHPSARLTAETLHTFMCQAEYIINSRPLTKLSDDVHDDSPLTPNHFLMMAGDALLPMSDSACSLQRRWRHVQFLASIFWRRWVREYLPLLQSRQKWLQIRENICVGSLVLVVDEQCPRGSWPLGLVLEVKEGRDGLVRSVVLKCKNKSITRPITKVVVLESVN